MMKLTVKEVKEKLIVIVGTFVALFVAEQILLKFLDWRAEWSDDKFKTYLANPGPRNENRTIIYDCEYQSIAWLYRYRICIKDVGMRVKNDDNVEEPFYYLMLIGATGYLSFIPEENGGRETWDSTFIWTLDKDLHVVNDLRKGVTQ